METKQHRELQVLWEVTHILILPMELKCASSEKLKMREELLLQISMLQSASAVQYQSQMIALNT